eukprot:45665-Amphidinium_carterae.2
MPATKAAARAGLAEPDATPSEGGGMRFIQKISGNAMLIWSKTRLTGMLAKESLKSKPSSRSSCQRSVLWAVLPSEAALLCGMLCAAQNASVGSLRSP